VDEVGPQVTWDRGCGISQIYESVICFGKAEFVEELDEKSRVLELMVREFIRGDPPLPLVRGNVKNTALIRICVEWMTGKANRISPLHRIVSNLSDSMIAECPVRPVCPREEQPFL
jgi:nitroimidazol reductase NimA-like FMN-containing flavoprotein (pyridoxamine 5'-phosphate oxidase superfamily)